MTAEPAMTRIWRPMWPVDPYDVLRVVRRGAGDPAFQRDADGTVWRATTTPNGVVTLRIRARRDRGEVQFRGWGPGAEWALETAPALLGAEDDVSDFRPRHPRVKAMWERNPHWRVTRTGLVLEALVAGVIEQKVTGREAWIGWRRLLHRFGTRAPGPGEDRRMRALPSARELALVPSWEWLRCSIDGKRADAIVRAARVAPALERTLDLAPDEADQRLRSMPGVGVWTSAEIRQRAHGHADAVSFGDYHIAAHVGYALTGTPFDDDELAALLEPDRPHRYRVQHIVTTRLPGQPRHGARMAPRTHLPS